MNKKNLKNGIKILTHSSKPKKCKNKGTTSCRKKHKACYRENHTH